MKFLIISMIVIASIISGCISRSTEEEDQGPDYELFLYSSGETFKLYTNQSNYKYLNEYGNNSDIPYTEIIPYYVNESYAYNISKRLMPNCIFEDYQNGTWFFHDENSTNIHVEIDDSEIRYHNENNYSFMDEKDFLNDSSLIKLAEDFIIKIRGNISDLELSEIGKSSVYKEQENGEIEYLGYDLQTIRYNQRIEGIPVAGCMGHILIRFDEGGEIETYLDRTIKWTKIEKKGYNISSLKEVIDDIVDYYDEKHPYEDIELKNFSLVYYSDSITMEPIRLHYELYLCPIGDWGSERKHYPEA